MPRKTNKTAHVLNLLASGSTEETLPQEEKQELAPNIAIVDNPTSPADPLADLIKNTLDKEISQESHQETLDDNTIPAADSNQNLAVSATDAPADEPLFSDPAPVVEEAAFPAPPVVKEDAVMPQEPQSAPLSQSLPPAETVTVAQPEKEPVTATVASVQPEKEPATVAPIEPAKEPVAVTQPTPETVETAQAPRVQQEDEPEFLYINLMDMLIEKRLDEFMNRFDTCRCSRCRLDVKALAMSNLPPKYIVIPPASLPPLSSFYANKFNILLVTELTKACLAIINHPRH